MDATTATGDVRDWFEALAERLRRVRVCCGDWSRITGPSVTFGIGMTGVFLDPPYAAEGRTMGVYAADCGNVGRDVHAWCLQNGDNPLLRIALCGYEGEYDLPGWACVPWKAAGGYGSQADGRGRDNAKRERIWFSPACLTARQMELAA